MDLINVSVALAEGEPSTNGGHLPKWMELKKYFAWSSAFVPRGGKGGWEGKTSILIDMNPTYILSPTALYPSPLTQMDTWLLHVHHSHYPTTHYVRLIFHKVHNKKNLYFSTACTSQFSASDYKLR